MTKTIYLGLSILEISKTLIQEFWCNYMKPKYRDRAKLCYIDSDSFAIYIEREDFYKNIAGNLKMV